eukprot:11166139-Alexandrium_andersonii.AAC.1
MLRELLRRVGGPDCHSFSRFPLAAWGICRVGPQCWASKGPCPGGQPGAPQSLRAQEACRTVALSLQCRAPREPRAVPDGARESKGPQLIPQEWQKTLAVLKEEVKAEAT